MSDARPIVLRAPDGSTVRVDRFPVTLGRAGDAGGTGEDEPDVDLSPFDTAHRVSARHAVLDWRPGGLCAIDLGSEHGTEVNGVRAPAHEAVEVGPAGVITCGSLPIAIEVESAGAGAGTTAAPPPPIETPPIGAKAPPSPGPGAGAPPVAPPPPPISDAPAAGPPRPRLRLPHRGESPRRQNPIELLLRGLDDPEVSDVSVERGRPPALRHRGVWVLVDQRPMDGRGWNAFWHAYCDRAGVDRHAHGYVARLLRDAVSVEAFLPPLTADPALRARRLPPARDLAAMETADDIGEAEAAGLREAIAGHAGILLAGTARDALASVLEALVEATPGWERVALVEPRPRLRVGGPQVVRLRPEVQGAAAYAAAAEISADWVAVAEALPETAAAALPTGADGPSLLLAARTGDVPGWRERAAAVAEETHGVREGARALGRALPLTVVVGPCERGGRVVGIERP